MRTTIKVHGKPVNIDVSPDKIHGGYQATWKNIEFNGMPSEKFARDMMQGALERL